MLTKKAMQLRSSKDTITAMSETIKILRQSFLSLAFRFADMFLFCFMLITIYTAKIQKKSIVSYLYLEIMAKEIKFNAERRELLFLTFPQAQQIAALEA